MWKFSWSTNRVVGRQVWWLHRHLISSQGNVGWALFVPGWRLSCSMFWNARGSLLRWQSNFTRRVRSHESIRFGVTSECRFNPVFCSKTTKFSRLEANWTFYLTSFLGCHTGSDTPCSGRSNWRWGVVLWIIPSSSCEETDWRPSASDLRRINRYLDLHYIDGVTTHASSTLLTPQLAGYSLAPDIPRPIKSSH